MRINSLVSPDALRADPVALSAEESHHLARVLRVEVGQELTLFDGQGTRAEAEVTRVDKKRVEATVTARETLPPPTVHITLIQAMCKPDRFDLILQKATELGVSAIQPVITQNCSLPTGKMQKMAERGDAILRNAAQQCGTAWMPALLPLQKMASTSLESYDAIFVGSLHANSKPFKESLREMGPLQRVALLIGPEGDLTEDEVNDAVKAGATPVTFGTQILRTETAAIFGLSVLSYELC
jgi:16S rRNA (uracil1498-N3)-methyltransferase